MNLPRADHAYVPPEKLSGYLLSESHPVGQGKARFFTGHGFSSADQDSLASALLEVAKTEEVSQAIQTAYGTKYVIEGSISTPSGRAVAVRTIWIVEPGDPRPRFVTVYPIS